MTQIKPRGVYVLSGRTARGLLDAPEGSVEVSLDLGMTRQVVRVEEGAFLLPDGSSLGRDGLAGAFREPEDCIEITAGQCAKVFEFDEASHRDYKLYQPVEGHPPTLLIAGHNMHAIVGMDPWQDARQKVRALRGRRGGLCLDTCFGLGYSAQLLAGADWDRVVSCEVDEIVLEFAAVNPWSRGAFESDRIELVHDDVASYLSGCADGSFAGIFHDPPVVHLAGELYGLDFYRELARVLEPRGVLYHYVGSPGGRGGHDQTRRVMQRLHEAGYPQTRRAPSGTLARSARR
ncbi:MAG: methyltransferase [Candidatus Brocadiia bacterium]|nr:methyltransferase [Candidatus Brocadiia bacterium]